MKYSERLTALIGTVGELDLNAYSRTYTFITGIRYGNSCVLHEVADDYAVFMLPRGEGQKIIPLNLLVVTERGTNS